MIYVYPDTRPIVNYDVLPPGANDHLLVLTDREIAILRMLAYPYLFRNDVALHPIVRTSYDLLTDGEQSIWIDEVGELVDHLSGSAPMDVEKVVAAFYGARTLFQEIVNVSNLPAGTSFSYGELVPAGYGMQLSVASFGVTSATATQVILWCSADGAAQAFLNVVSPVSSRLYTVAPSIWLTEGQGVYAYVVGATAGDQLTWRYRGWRVPVS